MSRPWITTEQGERMLALQRGGMSAQGIAVEVGRSPQTVHAWLRRHGSPFGRRHASPGDECLSAKQQAEMVRLHRDEHVHVRELARRFGVGHTTASEVLRKHDALDPDAWRRGSILTEEVAQKALRMLARGHSPAQIGERFGRSRPVVVDWLMQMGRPPATLLQTLTDPQFRALCDMVGGVEALASLSGHTMKALNTRFGAAPRIDPAPPVAPDEVTIEGFTIIPGQLWTPSAKGVLRRRVRRVLGVPGAHVVEYRLPIGSRKDRYCTPAVFVKWARRSGAKPLFEAQSRGAA